MKSILAVAAGCVTMASGAWAADRAPEPAPLGSMTLGYTYYNRPGAGIAAHDEAIKACAAEAMKLHYVGEGTPLTYTPVYASPGISPGAAAAGGIIGNLLVDAIIISTNRAGHVGAVAVGLENCMVVRGWRVVLLPDKDGRPLQSLNREALSAQLAAWIGQDAPPGKIIRKFNNEAASGVRPRLGTFPNAGDSVQLSYIAATGGSRKDFGMNGVQPTAPGRLLNTRRPTPWKATELPSSAGKRAIVIIKATGLSPKSGTGLGLEHLDSNGQVDERLGLDISGGMFTKTTGHTIGLLLTAGRWRIASIADLSFCLGAPAFDANPGDVIYAGAFDLKAPMLGPNLDLDAPKAWLGAAPSAANLKAAGYENGSTGVCGGNVLYALEFPEAPFAANYQWGSAAWRNPPADAPAAAVAGAATQ